MGVKNIAILIPTLNEEKHLGACLATVKTAITALSNVHVRVVISDGGSTDQTVTVAIANSAEIVGPAFGSIRGRGVQLNKAASFCLKNGTQPDLFLFLHADCILDPKSLVHLVATFGHT